MYSNTHWTSFITDSLRSTLRLIRVACCLGLTAWALGAAAMDTMDRDAALWNPQIPVITPLYLEKAVNPLSLGQETGWQLGGINSRFDTSGEHASLSIRGGFFYSQKTNGSQMNNPAFTGHGMGQQFNETELGALNLPRGLLFGSRSGDEVTDQISYQRVNFQGHGLSLSGSYASVGKDFQGLGDLVKQMAPGDPEGAKLFALGATRSNLNLDYTGIRGLALHNTMTQEAYEAAGDKNNGLTKSTRSTGLAYNFNERQRLEFSQTRLAEEWDPSVVKKDSREVETTMMRYTQQFGSQNSQLTLMQTDTATMIGETETDQRRQQYSLAWNEWDQVKINSGYLRQFTEQTGELRKTMNVQVDGKLHPNFHLVGRFSDGEILRPGADPVNNDTLNLKLVAQVLPTLKLNSVYDCIDTPDKGKITTHDQQVAWTVTPRWSMATRLLSTQDEKKGDTERAEYSLTGQLGTADHPQQLSLFVRTEELPNNITQTRQEVGYTRTLGTKETPVSLLVRVGEYGFTQNDVEKSDRLTTVQLLNLRPLKGATLSLGYYEGPTLGAEYLAYRAWGHKPQGNLNTWNAGHFVQYREKGAELVYQLNDATKVAIKYLDGERADTGQVDSYEYGVERKLGTTNLLFARRVTTQPGDRPDVTENWWQFNWADPQKMPAWANTAMRQTVFADTTRWGLEQPQSWATTPKLGFTLERRDEILTGKDRDAWSVRYAGLMGVRLLLLGGFDRDPRKTDKAADFEPVDRLYLHLGYQVRPNVQAYSRFVQEKRRDAIPGFRTQSVGFVGVLSPSEKLHLQLDAMDRMKNGEREHGLGYMLGYERQFNQSHSLLVKYRHLPKEFITPENGIQLEGRYQRAF